MSSFKLTRPEKVLLWLAISEIRHKEKVLAETWYEVDINDYATLAYSHDRERSLLPS